MTQVGISTIYIMYTHSQTLTLTTNQTDLRRPQVGPNHCPATAAHACEHSASRAEAPEIANIAPTTAVPLTTPPAATVHDTQTTRRDKTVQQTTHGARTPKTRPHIPVRQRQGHTIWDEREYRGQARAKATA